MTAQEIGDLATTFNMSHGDYKVTVKDWGH